jgi:hypothetical protein
MLDIYEDNDFLEDDPFRFNDLVDDYYDEDEDEWEDEDDEWEDFEDEDLIHY